ncbi:MAG: RsmB/NOP family class I SAM-dependent RNA methyltransferase [Spirochaetales bacterium]|nr:RsmB/NOP family class I SAM-dependent RNA methyltransferase [Spirochaetales bacterium]
MSRKEKQSGEQRFEQYYSELYGLRWPALREALLKETNPVSLSDELTSPYYMDKASILAASILPISENNSILDMCAAPGGKTLTIALRLKGKGSLVSNDRSAARRNRLLKVLDDCLPPEYRSIVKVTGHDSTTWSLHEKDAYDRILLDAPCSSERHVLTDPSALSIWSPNRPKQLSIQQFAMLAAALDAVKSGGYILYSTCSICSLENELVIEKLFKKRSGLFQEIDMVAGRPELESLSEPLPHGRIVLPDAQEGAGPLYFCLLRKS